MKKLSPKNIAIGLLLLSNVVMGAYIVAHHSHHVLAESAAMAAEPNLPPRKAMVHEANLIHNSELQACYETFLARGPSIEEGVVEMHWMLEKSGHISSLELVKTELPDKDLMECLMGKLNTMTFRAPASATLIAHKFTFKKKNTGKVTFQ